MTLEAFIDAVISHLKTDLPPRIVAMNTLHADDDIVLKVPKDDAYSTGGDPILKYPFIEVAAPDFSMYGFSVGQVDMEFEVDVVVRAFVQEVRPPIERADRHVKRFGSVLVESLIQPNAFGPHETLDRLRGAYRINPETDDGEGPIAAVTMVFTVMSVNVRP